MTRSNFINDELPNPTTRNIWGINSRYKNKNKPFVIILEALITNSVFIFLYQISLKIFQRLWQENLVGKINLKRKKSNYLTCFFFFLFCSIQYIFITLNTIFSKKCTKNDRNGWNSRNKKIKKSIRTEKINLRKKKEKHEKLNENPVFFPHKPNYLLS